MFRFRLEKGNCGHDYCFYMFAILPEVIIDLVADTIYECYGVRDDPLLHLRGDIIYMKLLLTDSLRYLLYTKVTFLGVIDDFYLSTEFLCVSK